MTWNWYTPFELQVESNVRENSFCLISQRVLCRRIEGEWIDRENKFIFGFHFDEDFCKNIYISSYFKKRMSIVDLLKQPIWKFLENGDMVVAETMAIMAFPYLQWKHSIPSSEKITVTVETLSGQSGEEEHFSRSAADRLILEIKKQAEERLFLAVHDKRISQWKSEALKNHWLPCISDSKSKGVVRVAKRGIDK